VVLDVMWLRQRMRIDLRTSFARLVDMVRQSLAYWAFGVFFTIYLWIDALMLSLMTNPEVVGWYGVPMKLFQTFMFLPVVISTAWLPRLVRAFLDGGQDELQRAARRPLEIVFVLSLPISAGIVICARPFVELLYGPRFAESVPILILLGLCIVPMYLNIILSQILVAAKRQVAWTWVMGGATVINPLLNLVLIPATQSRYGNGGIGAGIALLATELAIVAVGLVLIGRGVLDDGLVRRVGLTALASTAAWGASALAEPAGTVASLAAAAVAFAVLAWALHLATPAEIEHIRGLAARGYRRFVPRRAASRAGA
jgi:O-antigen/teichoic acid export membrane protein